MNVAASWLRPVGPFSFSALPGMIHQVLAAADHMARNIPESGQAIAGNSREGGIAIDPGRGLTSTIRLPLTSPTPFCVTKQAQQPAAAEYSQRQPSVLPSPPSSGELALQEVLSLMAARILPPYPCVGHHLPPSPSAMSFQHAPSSEFSDRSPPWPSKRPAYRCLW